MIKNKSNINISVIVPAYNEAESLVELCEWIDKVTSSSNLSYEIIMKNITNYLV